MSVKDNVGSRMSGNTSKRAGTKGVSGTVLAPNLAGAVGYDRL